MPASPRPTLSARSSITGGICLFGRERLRAEMRNTAAPFERFKRDTGRQLRGPGDARTILVQRCWHAQPPQTLQRRVDLEAMRTLRRADICCDSACGSLAGALHAAASSTHLGHLLRIPCGACLISGKYQTLNATSCFAWRHAPHAALRLRALPYYTAQLIAPPGYGSAAPCALSCLAELSPGRVK